MREQYLTAIPKKHERDRRSWWWDWNVTSTIWNVIFVYVCHGAHRVADIRRNLSKFVSESLISEMWEDYFIFIPLQIGRVIWDMDIWYWGLGIHNWLTGLFRYGWNRCWKTNILIRIRIWFQTVFEWRKAETCN